MAPRPGYGIPLDGILPMAAPGSEIEKLPTLFIGGISWKNSQGMEILLNTILSNEPWSFKRRRKYLEIDHFLVKADEIQENILINMRLQGQERWSINYYTKLDKSALLSVIIVVEDMTTKSQDRRVLSPSRERRWQHREETMATNREREAERDLDVREKPIRDREIMARKLADGTMTLARELAMDEADRLREQQEIELEQHRLQTLEEERKQHEEFDDEEGIESKRKRRILVPLEYSDNEDDENKAEERKKEN
ncbi:hypothetical protein RhiirA5_507253 [Rhizophagus irregularis]|uniref:Uncharacterized protein n=1 Tax=Rhizophagus irregularis TaxID=588596 RepID=A0A2N0NLY7_9GLOM|nr:hypothetical protein RhiirA5_507253 [Rhizophagus irregularis]